VQNFFCDGPMFVSRFSINEVSQESSYHILADRTVLFYRRVSFHVAFMACTGTILLFFGTTLLKVLIDLLFQKPSENTKSTEIHCK